LGAGCEQQLSPGGFFHYRAGHALAVRSWVNQLAPTGPGTEITRRTIEKEIERKRTEVAGETPSPLERLLAERVALCWLAANYADAEYTR
jgi:hypothetical protein